MKSEFEYAKPLWARFIGNTSCGFVHGQVYLVTIGNGNFFRPDEFVWIVDAATGKRCHYSSVAKLAENWEIPAKGVIR